MKAVAPKEIPPLPDKATEWRRMSRRGSVFHAHVIGFPVCGSKVYLDRFKSEEAKGLHDMQYWGVCPRCMKLANAQLGAYK